uniref:Carboxylic ester hydrolase n=1 Tax=Mycena chlorophos TaxID=658473 RepID=A0ABQ0LDL8_MYCCL|nr:predicted protein [Mycena chlorophos]
MLVPASLLCFVAAFGFPVVARAGSSPPLSAVSLDYGTFRGSVDNATGIISFRGIRFADPPVGSLRWKAPVSPPSKHLGTVDATQFGNACIAATQHGPGATTSEDCLFGNVYTPINATSNSSLPVLVFFHGGGFESGRSTKYPPEDLMGSSAFPFVMATFEYRLGQFGFLGGSAVKSYGALNAGLLDQKAALQWVQRYIPQFGGDPGNVTIWGQSAGAGSVVYHLMNNNDDSDEPPLFQQAMGDSPPLLSLLDYDDSFVENLFTIFIGYADCAKRSDSATMSCLRNADSDTLADAGRRTLLKVPTSLYPFGPVFDGSFILQRPAEALMSGNFSSVPVLFGSNSDEGANWSAKLPSPANTSDPSANQTTVYNFLKAQYPYFTQTSFNTAIATYYPLRAYGNYSLQGQQIYGEMRYICTALLVANATTAQGDDAYEYHWDNPELGSTHGDELVAFFNAPDPEDLDDDDAALLEGMREYFTAFVTGGAPESDSVDVNWTVADNGGSPRILFHPGEIGMEEVDDALAARCAFWRSIADELHV